MPDELAAAQTTEPSSKMAMAEMKVHLTEKMEYRRPYGSWKEAVARR
jgi:hypothetical protein